MSDKQQGDGRDTDVGEITNVLGRFSSGYYPYFDRAKNAFYWDRAATRTIVPLTAAARANARTMLRDVSPAFQIRNTTEVEAVLSALSVDRPRRQTWVRGQVIDVYRLLHRHGHLRTFEAWRGNELAGALLGVEIRNVFCAETMYQVLPGASKQCLCHTVIEYAARGFGFIDVQVAHPPPHPSHRIGEHTIAIADYVSLLNSQ